MLTRSNSYPERALNGLHVSDAIPFLHSNSQKDLSTADPNVGRAANSRHVRELNGVLHIRSLNSGADSFRNLREVLLQIRDSLSADDLAVSRGSAILRSDAPKTAKSQQRVQNQGVNNRDKSADDKTILAYRPTGPYTPLSPDHVRRSDRVSLPALHFRDYNNEDCARPVGTDFRWRLAAPSLRHRTNVKFADEFGLNLNTFVIIPSRFQRTESPTSRSAANGDRSVSNDNENGSRVLSPPKHVEVVDYRRRYETKPSEENAVQSVTIKSEPSLCLEHKPSVKSIAVPDEPASSKASTISPTSSILEDGSALVEPQFRLCFEQPFADQERFHRRLSSQNVCLENVRVEDWSLGGNTASTSTSLPQASFPVLSALNSVMLCSIRVNNVHPEKRVFARCTDNEWSTFTDLPAQHVGKIDSLGYAHDRFCFAVRRPLYTGNSDSRSALVAVEFAVCYEVDGETYWDNNEADNYRIEWY